MKEATASRHCELDSSLRGVVTAAALLLGTACGDPAATPSPSGGGAANISSAPLSGMVGGEPWVIGTADTDAFLSDGEDSFWVDAYETTLSACSGGFDAEGNSIILTVPKTPGTYPLSFTFTQTFVTVDDDLTTSNLGATEGTMVVTQVTESVVRASARITFDADNTVEGTFTANICP